MSFFSDDGDMPKRQVAQFDPYTSELLGKDISAPFQKPDTGAIDKNYAAGGDVYNQMGDPGLLGGSSFNQAIKEKYGRALQGDIDRMKNSERLNMRGNQLSKIKRAQQAVVAIQSVQNEAMTAQLEAQNMQESARAAAINSILQLGATAVGYGMAGMATKPSLPGIDPNNGAKMIPPNYPGKGMLGVNVDSFGGGSPGYNQSMNYLGSIQGIGER